jgi:hypothetical protein
MPRRNRAANRVKIAVRVTRAQAERLWKNWQTMKTVNGDVYRALRNSYSHLCEWAETHADRLEREATAIEGIHETYKGANPAREGVAGIQAKEARK